MGIQCHRSCKYKLKLWMQKIYEVLDSDRTQMRWDAYSTQLIKFYIPGTIKQIDVDHVILAAVSEDAYSRIEMYVSFDSKFSLADDRPSNLVLEDGVAMRLSKKDVSWCSKCYVYLLINVETEQRYYLTTKAYTKEPTLTSAVPLEITVNPF